jgi:5'/3'-nucleotidase
LLRRSFPPDVDLLKVEVPASATPETPWKATRVSRKRYYVPVAARRTAWDSPGTLGYELADDLETDSPDTDISTLRFQNLVSVSPMSLDLTSRVDLGEFEGFLHSEP